MGTPPEYVLNLGLAFVDRVVGFEDVRAGGHCNDANSGRSRLKLTKFHSPSIQGDNGHASANIPGIRHFAFAVEDIDAVVATLRARGAELVDELERYKDTNRLCYLRGPERIIIELAEHIS